MNRYISTLLALFLLAGCASSPTEPSESAEVAEAPQGAAAMNDAESLPTHGAPRFGRSDALVTLTAFVDPARDEFPGHMSELLKLTREREDDLRLVVQPAGNLSETSLQAWKLLHVAAANGEFERGVNFLVEWHDVWRSGDPIALAIAKEAWEPEVIRDHLASAEFKASLEGNREFADRAQMPAGAMFVNGVEVLTVTEFRSQFVKSLAGAQALLAEGVPREEIFAKSVETYGGAITTLDIEDSELVPVGDAAFKGARGATVTIVTFVDLQCPFSARLWQTVRDVFDKYPNDVRFVVRHFPLPFHRQAEDAAIAAEAARRQGKFFEFVAAVFQRQSEMKNDIDGLLREIAVEVGLDVQQFEQDRNDPKLAERIDADMKLGKKIGVRGTPNSRVNGVAVPGAQNLQRFDDIIQTELGAIRRMLDGGDTTPRKVYADRVAVNFEREERTQPPKPEVPRPMLVNIEPVDAQKGPSDAPVTIVIFSDLECPFCKRAVPTLAQIEQTYGKKVRFVFKHLPLPFHKAAKPMAYATIAAGQQGKFWEMHDLIFENQKAFKGNADAEAERLAGKLGLNMKAFRAVYTAQATKDQVETDLKEASRVGARGTPNFFVNGVKVVGAQPFEKFKEVIDEQLAIAKDLEKTGVKPSAMYEKAVKANQDIHDAMN